MRETTDTPDPSGFVFMATRVPAADADALRLRAREQDRSVSAEIRRAIAEHIGERADAQAAA